jgi:hypothetical protein
VCHLHKTLFFAQNFTKIIIPLSKNKIIISLSENKNKYVPLNFLFGKKFGEWFSLGITSITVTHKIKIITKIVKPLEFFLRTEN